MNLQKLIFTNNNCYKAGKTIDIKGVMWHSTGANNNKLSRYVGPNDGLLGENPSKTYWNQPKPDGREVCVHAFIGKLADGSIATYQTLPWNYRGWHCGSGVNGSGNATHISFEICEDALTDSVYFNAVYKEAVELTAYLCTKYSLNPLADGVVICHSEGHSRGIASNHGDVMHWFPKFGKTMDDARNDVAAHMGNILVPSTPEETVPHTVRVSITDLNIRTGPGSNYRIVGQTGIGVYTIVEVQGNWGRLKSGAGWIHLGYTTRLT